MSIALRTSAAPQRPWLIGSAAVTGRSCSSTRKRRLRRPAVALLALTPLRAPSLRLPPPNTLPDLIRTAPILAATHEAQFKSP